MTRRFLGRLPCMERRPAEAAVRFAQGAPERRNPVAAGVSDRIGMRFACHRGGDRECLIGAPPRLRLPMPNLPPLALLALLDPGRGIAYRTPLYRANPPDESALDPVPPRSSKNQVKTTERRIG